MKLLQVNRGLTFREAFLRKQCILRKVWYLSFIFPLIIFYSGCQILNGWDSTQLFLSLSGKWVSEDGSYMEEWAFDADTLLVGAGYEVKDDNKLRTEKLAVVYENDGYYYQATVSGQNKGQTITFGPAVFSGTSVFFENAKHDFPNILRYTFIGDSALKVSVESISDSSMNFQIDLKKDFSVLRQK